MTRSLKNVCLLWIVLCFLNTKQVRIVGAKFMKLQAVKQRALHLRNC